MENLNIKMETTQKNQMSSLELKSKISKIKLKNYYVELTTNWRKKNRPVKLESRLIENPVEEHRRKKKMEKN